MNKNIITIIVVAIVFAGGGFFGGMKYQQSKKMTVTLPNGQTRTFGQNGGGQGGAGNFAFRSGAGGAGRGGNGGGFVGGQILKMDASSLTIQLPNNGGSKIVFYSTSTPVGEMTQGKTSDLATGDTVIITGTTNADGSVTAQNIQIRPQPQQ